MPLTGIFLVPSPPNGPPQSTSITSHISLAFDCRPLHDPPTPYTVSHHLFASTSSLLPNKASTRQYTQLLSLSHTPEISYVGTTLPSEPTSQITIPTTSTDAFLTLVHSKLQPHWSPRQTLVVNDGTALHLETPLGAVELRIGDLRTAAGRTNPPSALKGMLVEVTQLNTDGAVGTDVKEQEKGLMRTMLERLLQNTSVGLGGEGSRESFRYTEKVEPDTSEGRHVWALSEMYMEVLRAKG